MRLVDGPSRRRCDDRRCYARSMPRPPTAAKRSLTHLRRASHPQALAKGARGALTDLTDDDQECDAERDAPERGDQELTACRPPAALPARLEDRQLLKLTLRAARVFAVSVALTDTAVAAVDK